MPPSQTSPISLPVLALEPGTEGDAFRTSKTWSHGGEETLA